MSETKHCPRDAFELQHSTRFRALFLARIPSGHTVEDVLSPEYFGQLINERGFKESDQIEVEWEDMTKWGLLQIRSVERTLSLVQTRERIAIQDDMDEIDLPNGWEMVFRGASAKWCIVSGGQEIEAGYPSPERAHSRILFLASHADQRAAIVRNTTRAPKGKLARAPKAEAKAVDPAI